MYEKPVTFSPGLGKVRDHTRSDQVPAEGDNDRDGRRCPFRRPRCRAERYEHIVAAGELRSELRQALRLPISPAVGNDQALSFDIA